LVILSDSYIGIYANFLLSLNSRVSETFHQQFVEAAMICRLLNKSDPITGNLIDKHGTIMATKQAKNKNQL